MTRPPAIVLLCLLFALSAAVLSAGEPVPEGGRFTVFAGGREAGTEVVRVSGKGGPLTLESRARLFRGGREQELTLRLVLDRPGGRVVSFAARGVQDGRERLVALDAADGRLAGETREGEDARSLSLPAGPGTLVLAEPFAAPYLLLLARYDRERGGPQTFPVVFPLEGRAGAVTLTLREPQALEIDGAAVLADRIYVEPDRGETANLWVDGEGRLLVCARSVAGISAVRGKALRIGLRPGEDPPDPPEVVSTRIRFAGGNLTLAGTLTRPRGAPLRRPAVLLLSGSGPHDRNGNVPGAELQWNPLHSFAVALGRRGIASLRYDERGVGSSGGTFYDAGLADLAGDARSALSFLAGREDVDPARIGILGHSEGALIGALLAAGKSPAVRAVVLVGAPAEPLDRVLVGQVRRRLERRGTPPPEAGRIVGEMQAFFEFVRLARTNVVTWKGQVREVRWLREHMEVRPLAVYGRLRLPVLVLHGERDVQVPVEQARRVAGSLGARATLRVLPGLDHFLMPTRGGLEGYGDARRRVAPAALEEAGAWLRLALR